MKFTCSAEIARPIDRVAALYCNESVREKWQCNFDRSEAISGTPGEVGAQARLFFTKPKGMELVETIVSKNLPHEITGKYEHVHMVNTMRNRFTSLGPDRTRYDAEIHYTQFNEFLPKMMGKLIPGMFRKQTQKWIDNFKAFAETQPESQPLTSN